MDRATNFPLAARLGIVSLLRSRSKRYGTQIFVVVFLLRPYGSLGKINTFFFFLLELQPKEREKSMCMYVMYVGMTLSFFVLRSELERSKEIVHSGMITASIAIISTIVVVVAVAESTTTITTVTVAVTGVSVHAKASKSRKHVRGR